VGDFDIGVSVVHKNPGSCAIFDPGTGIGIFFSFHFPSLGLQMSLDGWEHVETSQASNRLNGSLLPVELEAQSFPYAAQEYSGFTNDDYFHDTLASPSFVHDEEILQPGATEV
jgi:hypothetical protein